MTDITARFSRLSQIGKWKVLTACRGIPVTVKSKSREPRSRKPDPSSKIEECIRQRAYQLYEWR